MSTKPSDTGRFAVDGSDVDAVNISAPSSGLRDTGFPTNAVPTSGNFNYLENLAYRWRKYLSDGAFSGASSFDNDLAITGNLTLTGNYYHGTRTLQVNPLVGYPLANGPGTPVSGGITGVDLDWVVPLPMVRGDRILTVRVVVNNAVGYTYQVDLVSTVSAPPAAAPVSSTLGTSGSGVLSGTLETITIGASPLNHKVIAKEVVELKLTKLLTAGFTSRYYTVEVDYDRVP